MQRILLTGVTGYVGGRLLNDLLKKELSIHALIRSPEHFQAPEGFDIQVFSGDLLDRKSLDQAFSGVDTAYFLVHAMGASRDFVDLERRTAENFADAAKVAGVEKIIYLGGLGTGSDLSPHLRSRHEVGEILRSSGIPVVEFRASIIIGSGSLSFEMVRSLTDKLPFMITPRWVRSRCQPIAIEDVISYLIAVLEKDFSENKIYEIGGPDIIPYIDLTKEYARQRGLKRYYIPVPFLSPYLSSLWLGLITPLYARIGGKLIDSLRNDTLVEDFSALKDFHIRPIEISEAISRAVKNEDREIAQTRWYDAISSSGFSSPWGGVRFGSRIVDSRSKKVRVSAEKAFYPIKKIGGKQGWYYANFLWRIRAFLDLLIGGIGIRRGRSNPDNIRIGDAIDWWRVGDYKENRLLRLQAEMKVPGRAWLQFEVQPEEQGATITQTAIFDPVGFIGLLYWYVLYPLHALIFRGMLNSIAARAERL